MHILNALQETLNIDLLVYYVNHNLRAEESTHEEEFVRKLVGSFGHDIIVHVVEPDFFVGKSLELEARKLRYSLFESIVEKGEADYIATAHTLSDRIESFFINLLRGGGSGSLSSIPAINGKILRPLLSCTSEEIINYAKEQRLEWFEDSTNATLQFKRNQIRHEIIPHFSTFTGNFNHAMRATFEALDYDESFIMEIMKKEGAQLCCYEDAYCQIFLLKSFRELPRALSYRLIVRVLTNYGILQSPTRGLINEILSKKRLDIRFKGGGIFTKTKFIVFHNSHTTKKEITGIIEKLPTINL